MRTWLILAVFSSALLGAQVACANGIFINPDPLENSVSRTMSSPASDPLSEEKSRLAREMLIRVFQPDFSARPAVFPVQRDWTARRGSSIRQVLERWSQIEGVHFIWDGGDDFAALAPIEIHGRYEVAVQAILNQYQSSFVRPVGRLHVDEAKGERTLAIRILKKT